MFVPGYQEICNLNNYNYIKILIFHVFYFFNIKFFYLFNIKISKN